MALTKIALIATDNAFTNERQTFDVYCQENLKVLNSGHHYIDERYCIKDSAMVIPSINGIEFVSLSDLFYNLNKRTLFKNPRVERVYFTERHATILGEEFSDKRNGEHVTYNDLLLGFGWHIEGTLRKTQLTAPEYEGVYMRCDATYDFHVEIDMVEVSDDDGVCHTYELPKGEFKDAHGKEIVDVDIAALEMFISEKITE